MLKLRFRNIEKAQGMVEFALVLPILLLIFFGIIGFGHLFFSYTATVNASREAARFGSAVGDTDSGVPHFRDCDAIIDRAVEMGRFAGVTAGTVTIAYDRGPEDPGEYGTCPPGGTGEDAQLGDRIVVRLAVPYRSIVPLVEIPNLTLRAETRRTIVRSLPVGDAPTAEPLCTLTTTEITVSPEPSVTGEFVNVTVNVIADSDDQPSEPGTIHVRDLDGNNAECTLDAPGGTCTFQYWETGFYRYRADYDGEETDESCFHPSNDEYSSPDHEVIKADTQTTITSIVPPNGITIGGTALIYVNVQAVAPGARLNWVDEEVTVSDSFGTCVARLDSAGNGFCPIQMTILGQHQIIASYPGDDNYNPSSTTMMYVVYNVTPSPAPSLTPIVTPTPTLAPPNCPVATTAMNFSNPLDGLYFDVTLPRTATSNVSVTSVLTEWPGEGAIARLTEIRFDDRANRIGRACGTGGNASDCIWYANPGGNPSSFLVNGTTSGWRGGSLDINQTKQMRLMFSQNLQNGPYRVTIQFNNNCTLVVEGNRFISQ